MLSDKIEYDPATGLFRRKLRAGPCKPGDWFPGNLNDTGYRRIRIDNRMWLAHRLAYALMIGDPLPAKMDHINGDRSDNRWCNLRPASHQQNAANKSKPRNNTSGFKGVVRSHCRSKPWKAQINANGAVRNLGYFATPEEAQAEYMRHAVVAFGEFAKAG